MNISPGHVKGQQPLFGERFDNEDFRIYCVSSEAAAQLQHALRRVYAMIDTRKLSSDAKMQAYTQALSKFWDFAERSLPVPGESFGSRINRCQ